MIKVTIPIKTKSEANQREHWAAKARRVKQQRDAVRLLLNSVFAMQKRPTVEDEITIQITRIASRDLDTDNLAGSMKAVRDGVADALRINDGHECITWEYDQRRGKYAVEIKIIF